MTWVLVKVSVALLAFWHADAMKHPDRAVRKTISNGRIECDYVVTHCYDSGCGCDFEKAPGIDFPRARVLAK